MILLWAGAVGFLVGTLRKGTLRQLGKLRLRHTWLVFLSFFIQILIFPLFKEEPIIGIWTPYFYGFSYFLLISFTVLNIRIWQIGTIGLGMLLNITVIVSNGGYMPASISALNKAGKHLVAKNLSEFGVYGNLIDIGRKTNLELLGDRLYLPDWLPLSNAFSVGDALIGLGVIMLLADKMVERPVKKEVQDKGE